MASAARTLLNHLAHDDPRALYSWTDICFALYKTDDVFLTLAWTLIEFLTVSDVFLPLSHWTLFELYIIRHKQLTLTRKGKAKK